MDDVRNAAGVSLKRLYSLFPGKDSLVLAVLRKRHPMWTDGLTAAVEAIDDPRDRLLAVYDFLAEWFAQDSFRGCGFINAFGELGPTSPEVAAYAREHKRSFQDQLAALVADAGVDPSLAPQLAILAEGAQTTAAIEGSPDAAATRSSRRRDTHRGGLEAHLTTPITSASSASCPSVDPGPNAEDQPAARQAGPRR